MKNKIFIIFLAFLFQGICSGINVSLPDTGNISAGQNIRIPLITSDVTGQNILSFYAKVKFNPLILNCTGASKSGTISSSWAAPAVNFNNTAGEVSIGGYGTSPISGSGNLIYLNFTVVGTLGTASYLNFISFQYNEGIPGANLENGILFVGPIFFSPTNINLISPLDNSFVSGTEVSFKWSKSMDNCSDTKYHLQVSSDSLFSNFAFNDSLIIDTVKIVNTLNSSTDYFWRVKAANPLGESEWSGVFKFSITVICKYVYLNSGWNIVSVPLNSQSMLTQSVFPNYTSPTYGYNNGYQTFTTLQNGLGYWIRYGEGDSINLCGSRVEGDTISLKSGWNLIGVYEKEIVRNTLTTTPENIINSLFYGYNNAYSVPDTLKSGKGYWVRASQNGVININNVLLAKGNETSIINDKLSSLILTDREGKSSTLYLSEGKENLSNYDLPPVPPEGIFDVRFASDRMVEDLTSSKEIVINSAEYPVVFRVEGLEVKVKVKVEKGMEKIERIMKDGETILVGEGSRIFIETVEIPGEFALAQNYPNPFNPSTVIRYQLPVDSKVTLKLYDILGREVAVLVDLEQQAGSYNYQLTISDKQLSSGVYIYRMIAGDFGSVKKLVVLK